MAHALYGHDGPCKNIHGHTYHLSVTLLGEAINDDTNPKNGMVIDFGELKSLLKKSIIDVFDHALVLNGASPHKNLEVLHRQFDKIILTPFQPTCENLIIDIKNRIKASFTLGNIKLIGLRLDETPTSSPDGFL